MKKLLLVSLCFLMFCITQVFAQGRTVIGTVTAKDDGLPIPGVTVKVKGTTTGVQTNAAGKYTLSNVPPGAVLVFSFIGYETTSLTANGSVLNAELNTSTKNLGEVVITSALGIKHSKNELGYAVSKINSKELTETNVVNLANGLTAKVAGLAVFTLDNGIDPNVSVVLRGNRSLEGNNTALIVLDGVPLPGATLSSINPDDVADVTVLKGAGSAAIYGSEASNGAILVTTKRGSTNDGKPTINYSNSFQFEKVAFFPKLQTRFGTFGGEPNYIDPITGFTQYVPYENQQYGPAYDGSTVILGAPLDSAKGKVVKVPYSPYPTSPIEAFFNRGYTEQNEISYQQGTDKNSVYVSAQHVYKTGITPKDLSNKFAFSLRGHNTAGIFSIDYSFGYTKTNVETYVSNNNPYGIPGSFVTNAGYNDLYTSILQFPAFYNIKSYQDPNSQLGNVNNFPDAYAINPYWIIYNARRNYTRDVILSQLKLKLDPTKWFSASYTVSDNFGIYQEHLTKSEVDFSAYAASDYWSAGNTASAFKTTLKVPGTVIDSHLFGDGSINLFAPQDGYSRLQGDALLDFHHTFFNDLKTSLLVGNSVYEKYKSGEVSGSTNLLLPNFYNINTISGQAFVGNGSATIRQIASFVDLNIGYKNWVFLEGTYRNERDSRLSAAERSFSYPSIKLSFIPTEAISALQNNDILSYAKLYGSISQVGNINIGPYEINNVYGVANGFPYGSLGGLSASTTSFSPTLKPEITNEKEIGAEFGFFKSRVNLNVSYYNQQVKNQTVGIGTSITTGYNTSVLNIGETQSTGLEYQFTGIVLPKSTNTIGLTLGANLSKNESKVISLLPGENGKNSISSLRIGENLYAVVGKPFPQLEGTDFVRDPNNGKVIVDANNGYPSQNGGALTQFGRTTPEYILGLNAQVSYKFITLTALAEYRGGDVVYNGIGPALTFSGASAQSASAGRQPFVYPNSEIQTSPGVYVANTNVTVLNGNYGFWQGSAYSGAMSPFVSSGAFWNLREVNLNFDLTTLVKKSKIFKAASFALTGRNLFIWTPKSNPWTDPEFADNSGSTAVQGAVTNANTQGNNSVNQLPGTRIFGANLKVTF